MDVIFNCSKCSQELEVDEAAVGQQIDCPSCGEKLTIPPPDPNRKPKSESIPASAVPPVETKAPELQSAPAAPEKPAEAKPGEPEPAAPKEPPPPEHKKAPLTVPQYDKPGEILVKKTDAKAAPKDEKKCLRTRTIRRNQCMEVGHDLFDEKVTEFIQKVGEENVQSITPVSYGYIDTVGHMMPDYGVLIIYKG